ncbi:T-lymphocyte surface antigen Ly-9-like, partial [Mustelus asterias]
MEPKSQPAPYLLLLVSMTVSWLQAWTVETTAHPEVTIEQEWLSGMVGEAVLFPVSVVTVPGECRISWKAMRKPPVKVAEVILQENRTVVYPGTGFENRIQLFPNFTLQIQNLTLHDQGHYKVTLSVNALEPEASIRLDVYEPIRGTAVTINSVDSTNQTCVVMLSCSTMGGTAVSFSWGPGVAGDSVTANGSSLEVTLNRSSVLSARVCTARNPVSWQDSSVDLVMACRTNNTEVSQLTSGQLAIPVVSCGVLFFFLIAAGFVYWSHRDRSARWEDLTS